jgi:hypothetical protein
MLDFRDRGVRRISVVLDLANRPPWEGRDGRGAVGPWTVGRDGNLWRTVLLPRGANEETKRRLLATP